MPIIALPTWVTLIGFVSTELLLEPELLAAEPVVPLGLMGWAPPWEASRPGKKSTRAIKRITTIRMVKLRIIGLIVRRRFGGAYVPLWKPGELIGCIICCCCWPPGGGGGGVIG